MELSVALPKLYAHANEMFSCTVDSATRTKPFFVYDDCRREHRWRCVKQVLNIKDMNAFLDTELLSLDLSSFVEAKDKKVCQLVAYEEYKELFFEYAINHL